MVQIGSPDDEDKPKFASIRKDQSITNITLEEALDLFKLPRKVGEYEGAEISAAAGRFGPYLRHKSAFYSIREADGDDPLSIEIDRAIELIEAKRKADRERLIKEFSENPEMQLLNGRWGPYLKVGKENYKLPKGTEAENLTYEQCLKIAQDAPAKSASGRGRAAVKSTSTAKPAAKKTSSTAKKSPSKKKSAKAPGKASKPGLKK